MSNSSQLVDDAEFRAWVASTTGIGGRQLGDIVSRSRRAARMVDLRAAESDTDVEVLLLQSSDFQECSQFVRSQLRRAAKLLVAFRQAK